ncbi:MAG TPA: DUF1579 domain-containing protein [Allosphingosinicella sp.]|jgi:hypothetical protein|nr:DUF1579 domain-containing protein [Allosphingosinicella sp.]
MLSHRLLPLTLALAAPAAAQQPDPSALHAAQREAMARLSPMDGVWRGTAWTMTPAGRRDVVHTERIGPFLGGAVKVIEGRAYNPDGSVGFNAFGIVSYDPASKTYSLRSYAMGHSGDFPLDLRPDGYVWQTPAGPGAVIRYTATIGSGTWREVGERIVGNAEPVRIFEMNLKRVGDTSWPAGDPVPMK